MKNQSSFSEMEMMVNVKGLSRMCNVGREKMLEFKRKKRAPVLVLSYNNATFATSSIAIAPNLKALVVGL